LPLEKNADGPVLRISPPMETTLSDYSYTDSAIAELVAVLSPERLAAYVKAAGDDTEKALKLYVWNTGISEALYGPLQVLEVALRNAVNRELCAKYGSDWFRNAKPALFIDRQAEKLEKTISRFDKGRSLTVNDVVADLGFGFWSDLFDHQMYDELWKQALHKVFSHRPKGIKRNTIAIPIKRLNTLRNRIAHHEPIWNRDLQKDYDLILELTSWISPVARDWLKHQGRFEQVLKSKP
jgi:hypothetical protein